MQYAVRILPCGMDRAVNGEARRIDLVRRVHDLVAVEIDLHQAGRGDLVEGHPVRVDQEMMLAARNAGREMREYEIVPAEMRDQPIGGRERHALLPFFGGDQVTYTDRRLLLRHCSLLGLSTLGEGF